MENYITKIKGRLKFKFLILYLTVYSAFPTMVFLFAMRSAIYNYQKFDNWGTVITFGTFCLLSLGLIFRFYKLVSIDSGIISIYYPFLFFYKKRIKITDITEASQFDSSFFVRNPFSWNTEKYYYHHFSFYKTCKNDFVLLSDFNFKNYDQIIGYIDKQVDFKGRINFIRRKHQVMFMIALFAFIFAIAIFAT